MSKYKNVKTEYNGIKYDSKKEAAYAQTLDLLKKAEGKDKLIKWTRQIPFQISIGGEKICKYIADFHVSYSDRNEIVDVKGYKTAMYRLKKKLVEAQYMIKIKEV
jgi:uncharacterized protein YlaN (UPF0358 family)